VSTCITKLLERLSRCLTEKGGARRRRNEKETKRT